MGLTRKQRLVIAVITVPLGLGLLSVVLAPFGFPALFGLGNASAGVIEELRKIDLPDYTIGEASTEGGGFGHPANDMSFSAKKITSDSTVAAECESVIAAAMKLGASSWYFDPDYVALPLSDHGPEAQFGCVQILNSQLGAGLDPLETSGSPIFGLLARATDPGNAAGGSFRIEFNAQLDARATAADPKVYHYNLYVSTNAGVGDERTLRRSWDEALAAIPPSSRAFYQLLDRVGAYRAANPAAAPYAPATITAALSGYAQDFPQVQVTPITNQRDEVRWLQVDPGAAGGRLPACVSIRQYDPAFTGVADPGSGYVLGFVGQFSQDMQFGQALTGSCPTS